MKVFKAVLSMIFCALLLCMPCRVCAAGDADCTAEISFTFQNESLVPHTCTAVIEPVGGAPAPEQSEAEAQSGGEGRFVVRFSHPDQYHYRVYQTNKNETGVVYDDSVYTLTVVVKNAQAGGLDCLVWATLNGAEKEDAIQFVNRDRMPTAETKAPSDGKVSDTKMTELTDAPSASAASEGNAKAFKTGDDGRPALFFVMAVLSVLLLLFIVLAGKDERKAGDGI